MEKTRAVPSSNVFQLAEALDEMAQEGSSTLVRDESSTSDDMLATLPVVKNMAAECEGHIRESLGVVGYRVISRLDNHDNRYVFLARRLATGENVAIKVLVERPRDTSSAVKRFHQEARLLASLSHPNLVKAVAHGSLSHVHYLVLELAAGVNLRKKVSADGPLSVRQAVSVLWQAAQALGCAHRHGVIHRDVKPSNLVIGPDGRVKLVDLGLARLPCSPQESLTMIHRDQLLGTPDFMAPEQALDCHQVDARADLYALGCTLYFLLTGSSPFSGKTTLERMLAHQSVTALPLSQQRSDVPEELSRICEKLMAKNPEERHQSTEELCAELAPWLARPARPAAVV